MARLREDDIVSTTLLKRFEAEGQFEGADGRHYGLILRDDGTLLAHHPFSPALAPDQMMWARDVLKLLNRELHHDGAWVVVFTHVMPPMLATVLHNPTHADYGRYCLIWIDSDGDPQFTIEWEAGTAADLVDFADVMLAGIMSTAQKCEAAWEMWAETRRALDLKPSLTYKKAKGERAPSVH